MKIRKKATLTVYSVSVTDMDIVGFIGLSGCIVERTASSNPNCPPDYFITYNHECNGFGVTLKGASEWILGSFLRFYFEKIESIKLIEQYSDGILLEITGKAKG